MSCVRSLLFYDVVSSKVTIDKDCYCLLSKSASNRMAPSLLVLPWLCMSCLGILAFQNTSEIPNEAKNFKSLLQI